MPRPTIGRIVHYVYGPDEHRPAIIVDVLNAEMGMVQLQVFNDSDAEGIYNDMRPAVDWKTSVPHDEEASAGSWHWPERVEG